MSAETAGFTLGLKTGLFALLGAFVVSALAVSVGFTIIPLDPVRPMRDAARRLAAGLFCSFTLGPVLATLAIDQWPVMLKPWAAIFPGEHALVGYLFAAAPVIAGSGILGFWIVAAIMKWFVKREGKDIAEIVRDARADIAEVTKS